MGQLVLVKLQAKACRHARLRRVMHAYTPLPLAGVKRARVRVCGSCELPAAIPCKQPHTAARLRPALSPRPSPPPALHARRPSIRIE